MHLSLTLPRPFHSFHPMRRIATAMALRKERRALLALDQHLLRDVGLTRFDAVSEAERMRWDAPKYWLRS